jgi:hypothetical protein
MKSDRLLALAVCLLTTTPVTAQNTIPDASPADKQTPEGNFRTNHGYSERSIPETGPRTTATEINERPADGVAEGNVILGENESYRVAAKQAPGRAARFLGTAAGDNSTEGKLVRRNNPISCPQTWQEAQEVLLGIPRSSLVFNGGTSGPFLYERSVEGTRGRELSELLDGSVSESGIESLEWRLEKCSNFQRLFLEGLAYASSGDVYATFAADPYPNNKVPNSLPYLDLPSVSVRSKVWGSHIYPILLENPAVCRILLGWKVPRPGGGEPLGKLRIVSKHTQLPWCPKNDPEAQSKSYKEGTGRNDLRTYPPRISRVKIIGTDWANRQ